MNNNLVALSIANRNLVQGLLLAVSNMEAMWKIVFIYEQYRVYGFVFKYE